MESAPPTLRTLADRRGLLIGACVADRPLADDPLYAALLARELNAVVPENMMKMGPLRPSRDRWNWGPADSIVAFAQQHRMKVRGHTLAWHGSLPAWVTGGNFAQAELRGILEEHIRGVVGHYRGRVFAWDVVNEAVDGETGGLRPMWAAALGPECLDLAFRWAHEADPQAQLFYNDFGGEGLTAKSAAIYRLVSGMLGRGVPVHGVGLQMHVGLHDYPSPAGLAANINRLAALGLQVHVTELDVQIQRGLGTPQERLAAQARVYGDLVAACLDTGRCQAILTWGVTDRYSWIPHHTGRPDAPLLFDEAGRPKPAYEAVAAALRERTPA